MGGGPGLAHVLLLHHLHPHRHAVQNQQGGRGKERVGGRATDMLNALNNYLQGFRIQSVNKFCNNNQLNTLLSLKQNKIRIACKCNS